MDCLWFVVKLIILVVNLVLDSREKKGIELVFEELVFVGIVWVVGVGIDLGGVEIDLGGVGINLGGVVIILVGGEIVEVGVGYCDMLVVIL